MKITNFLAVALITCANQAYAGKTYMALAPTTTDLFAIVSIAEKPCNPNEGNAMYAAETPNGKVSALGCWKLDGNTVKIEWSTGDSKAPASFDFSIFKPISYDGTPVRRQGSKITLNCSAPGWVGDILVERSETGSLEKLIVAGEDVSFSEKGTAINFTYKGKNISLSTTTGIFNYETSGFQSYLNNRLFGGGNVAGTGSCKIADSTKRF